MRREPQPVEEIKGIGEKTGKLFRKLGVATTADLLQYYPRAYDTFHEPVTVGEQKEGCVGTVSGVLAKPPELLRAGEMQIVVAVLKDLTGTIQLTWYNMPYLRTNIKTGTLYIFRGRVARKKSRLLMEQPEIFLPEAYQKLVHSLQPVYGQTKGLGNKTISRAVAQALKLREEEPEYLPQNLVEKYGLTDHSSALTHIHFPGDEEELLTARKRLVFEEFFFFLLGVRRLREQRGVQKSDFVMQDVRAVDVFQKALPYALTQAQERTWQEIQKDMKGGQAMNRLIQGDVGSGKTILAILALLLTAGNGFQGALMVPTEVLARQHAESMEQLFAANREILGEEMEGTVVLVTGSMTVREKRLAYEKIRSGEAKIIVGTHALIQEKVEYASLALVITDEQHRFGVGQREALGEKSKQRPHVMVMSATPIPRTLAIILYGDLDISVVDQLPANRLPIKNCVVGTDYRKNAYAFITRQVAQGRQAYVICPMVEESEMIEAENVLDYTKQLRKELPESIRVEYLHGKLKGKEKNQIMEAFAAGEIQVLVSTTVIEVGVNVPNATVMMIENAERFGLAQLHQLRGRVGRGNYQSYCIMINCVQDEDSNKRLDILNHSNDGFYIASEDLKLRGPGDIFGIRQSGEMEFKLADIFTDANLLKTISEEVNHLLESDPELEKEGHQALKRKLEEYVQEGLEKVNL